MIQDKSEQFTGAVSLEYEVPIAGLFIAALVTFSAAPTTTENLTVTFKSRHGTAFDTVIHTIDPSTDSLTDIYYAPEAAVPLNKGDKILLEYTNTDTGTIGVTLKGLDSDRF